MYVLTHNGYLLACHELDLVEECPHNFENFCRKLGHKEPQVKVSMVLRYLEDTHQLSKDEQAIMKDYIYQNKNEAIQARYQFVENSKHLVRINRHIHPVVKEKALRFLELVEVKDLKDLKAYLLFKGVQHESPNSNRRHSMSVG